MTFGKCIALATHAYNFSNCSILECNNTDSRLKRGTEFIVNISSMASQRVITKVLSYTLAKTAIDAYTQWFAVEMANRHGDKLSM